MGKLRGVWLGLVLAALGCSRQDPECLARVGTRVGHKAESVLAGNDVRLVRGWQSLRGEIALDARVMARLSSDKLLAKQPIQVQVSGGEVQLLGKVENYLQRRRAVQLTEGTVGVEKVVDRLEGP